MNFLKKKNIRQFLDVPIFIYHGIQDKNCSYADTRRFVKKLKELGGNVEFHEDNAGHSKLENLEIIKKYNEWLQKLIMD